METKDIADLFITATGKIEFYWNFYTVTVLALIGWLVSTKNPLAPQLKVLISIGYLVFVFMNIKGLYGSYMFAEALRLDLLASSQSCQTALDKTCEVLSDISYESQKNMVLPIHFLVGSFVLFTVWFGRLGEGNSASE